MISPLCLYTSCLCNSPVTPCAGLCRDRPVREALARAYPPCGPAAYNPVMRGARITVRCDCGAVGYVPYGERWQCDGCRRRWNTGQIPADEYWGIMRDMRKMRINVLFTMLAITVPIAAVSLFLGPRLLLLLPVV